MPFSLIDPSSPHVIRMVYVEPYYPYFFEKGTDFAGGIYELIKWMAAMHGKTIDIYRAEYDNADDDNNEMFDGALGEVLKGRALTTIEGRSLRSDRFVYFKHSQPIYYSTVSFYEKDRNHHEDTTAFVFFSVYSVDVICLIVVAIGVFRVVAMAHRRSGHTRTPFSRISHRLALGMFIMGIFILSVFHSAGFKGNNVAYEDVSDTIFEGLVHDLRTRKRKLLTSTENDDSEEDEHFLIGHRSPDVVVYDLIDRLRSLCSRRDLVTRIYDGEVMATAFIDRDCVLRKIPVTDVDGTRMPGANFYIDVNPYYFLFARNVTTKKEVEYIDKFILMFFDEDKRQSFWMHRYVWMDPRKNEETTRRLPTFAPLHIQQFRLVFLICGPLYSLGFVLFLLEMTTPRRFIQIITHRLHRLALRIAN